MLQLRSILQPIKKVQRTETYTPLTNTQSSALKSWGKQFYFGMMASSVRVSMTIFHLYAVDYSVTCSVIQAVSNLWTLQLMCSVRRQYQVMSVDVYPVSKHVFLPAGPGNYADLLTLRIAFALGKKSPSCPCPQNQIGSFGCAPQMLSGRACIQIEKHKDSTR
jgi:hypothetical protein